MISCRGSRCVQAQSSLTLWCSQPRSLSQRYSRRLLVISRAMVQPKVMTGNTKLTSTETAESREKLRKVFQLAGLANGSPTVTYVTALPRRKVAQDCTWWVRPAFRGSMSCRGATAKHRSCPWHLRSRAVRLVRVSAKQIGPSPVSSEFDKLQIIQRFKV